MLRSNGKQSRESMESVLKKKRNATVGRICRKGMFYEYLLRLSIYSSMFSPVPACRRRIAV